MASLNQWCVQVLGGLIEMTRIERLGVGGVYPAVICPLSPDFEINEPALAEHIKSLDQIPGVNGFLINGHAGENSTLTREEKLRVIEVARATVSEDTILVCGVNAESTDDAVAQARDVATGNGDAIMIFPPNSWEISATLAQIVAHHKAIIDAVDLPVFLYQAPHFTGPMAYPAEVIKELICLPRIIAIKEGSWETSLYDANRRLVKKTAPSIAVMASGDEHLLTCFVLGSEGSIVSLAIIIPEVIVSLEAAVKRGDLPAAQTAHEIIYPLAKIIYGTQPANLATARLKTCLKLLGRIECDVMRLPVLPLPAAEVKALRDVLVETSLLENENSIAINA